MYKARRYLNYISFKNFYHAYIYPYLTYCIAVWGPASKCHLNSLFLLQKQIIRIMTISPYLVHTDPIFKNLTILPLDNFFIDRIGITMFKAEYELLPKSVIQMFSKNRDIHSHDTSNQNLFRVATGTKNFTFLSARIWNAIVSKSNINVSLSQFKNILKIYLLHSTLVYTCSK